MMQKLTKYLETHSLSISFVVCSVYVLISVLPFLIHGNHPFGYDTGFYRRYLINSVVSFPNTAVPGLDHTIIAPRIFLDVLRLSGLNPDSILYGSLILLLLGVAGSFYYFIRVSLSRNSALGALILLILSPLQYLGYWFILYKNFFALIFFFLAFAFLKKNRLFSALICSLLIPLSHQTTTIVFLAILSVHFVIVFIRERKVDVFQGALFFLTLVTYLYLHPHVQQKIDAPPVAIFIEKMDFLILMLPLLILSLFGIKKFYQLVKGDSILFAFGIVCIAFPLFSLPYYQRIFLFTHYWLIVGAVIGVQTIVQKIQVEKQSMYRSTLCVVVILCVAVHTIFLGGKVYTLKPLVAPQILHENEKLSAQVPPQASILTSARLTPWVQGWTTAKVYAPGVLKDKHSPFEWQMYRSIPPREKILFLSDFPHPLYIFIDDAQKDFFVPQIDCIQKVSDMLYRDDCFGK